MQKNTILFVIIAALGGFIAGFLLANSINRSQLTAGPVKKETTSSSATPAADDSNSELTAAEIKSKIAEADKNPTNFEYQKSLGTALYRYANATQAPELLSESARILDRANSIKSGDFDVLVSLGNARFDIAYATTDTAGFKTARDIYTQALEIKPNDPDVTTDRALTYFFQSPADYDKAASELQRVSDANPKHERSLQFLVQVFVKQNKIPEAEKALAKIKSINPSNRSLSELESKISEARSAK